MNPIEKAISDSRVNDEREIVQLPTQSFLDLIEFAKARMAYAGRLVETLRAIQRSSHEVETQLVCHQALTGGEVHELDTQKRPPTMCDECDGTGWTEGGEGNAMGAKCKPCHGTGIAPYQRDDVDLKLPPVERPQTGNDSRDAARYRWMRDNWGYAHGNIFFDGFALGPFSTLDEAIDSRLPLDTQPKE